MKRSREQLKIDVEILHTALLNTFSILDISRCSCSKQPQRHREGVAYAYNIIIIVCKKLQHKFSKVTTSEPTNWSTFYTCICLLLTPTEVAWV